MKNQLRITAAAAALLLAVTGCGGGGESGSTEPGSFPSEVFIGNQGEMFICGEPGDRFAFSVWGDTLDWSWLDVNGEVKRHAAELVLQYGSTRATSGDNFTRVLYYSPIGAFAGEKMADYGFLATRDTIRITADLPVRLSWGWDTEADDANYSDCAHVITPAQDNDMRLLLSI